MSLKYVSLSAGDQGNRVAYRSFHGDRSPSAVALAMVSGDSSVVARPEVIHPGPTPRQAMRPSVRTESRWVTGGGRGLTRLIRGRDSDGRSRGYQARFSPYPTPGVKQDLLRRVLQQRLIAFGGFIAARISA
ncbi:uncharacterized protein C11orf71 homolog [Choloepus didactylus]|uniref:uncharacterized protein C11orf71 homolog n=1 Tax=Choloepus didactylus TaxID=27675 RepID=UPI0018A0295B|nr:uncharacterized protein C11orf71 homolog [Choloepus didactylus]